MIAKHHNGTAKQKAAVEYRLTDANWHRISMALSEGRYGDAQKYNDEDFPTKSERGGYRRKESYQNASRGNSGG